MSGVLSDSWVSPVVQAVATQAVEARLRKELGLSYATHSTVERVDANTLLMVLSSDIDPERPELGVRQLSIATESLAQRGAVPEEFEGARNRLLRSLRDELTGAWQAFNSARSTLQGREPVTEDDVVDRLTTCTPEAVDEQLRGFHATALFAAPRGTDPTSGLPMSDPSRSVHFSGVPRSFPDWNPASRSRLVISDRSLMASAGKAQYVKRLDQAVALLQFGDGARTVVLEDGSSFYLDNHAWRDGDRAVALLDQAVAADLHVPMDSRPAADLTPAPTPVKRILYPLRRAWHEIRRAVAHSYRLLGGIVLSLGLLAGGVLLMIHGHARWGSYLLLLSLLLLSGTSAAARRGGR